MSEITFSQVSTLDEALKKAYTSCLDTLIVHTGHQLDGSKETESSFNAFQKQWENVKNYILAMTKVVTPDTKIHIHFNKLHPAKQRNRWFIITQIAGRTAFRVVFESEFFPLDPLPPGHDRTEEAKEFWNFSWKTEVSVDSLSN